MSLEVTNNCSNYKFAEKSIELLQIKDKINFSICEPTAKSKPIDILETNRLKSRANSTIKYKKPSIKSRYVTTYIGFHECSSETVLKTAEPYFQANIIPFKQIPDFKPILIQKRPLKAPSMNSILSLSIQSLLELDAIDDAIHFDDFVESDMSEPKLNNQPILQKGFNKKKSNVKRSLSHNITNKNDRTSSNKSVKQPSIDINSSKNSVLSSISKFKESILQNNDRISSNTIDISYKSLDNNYSGVTFKTSEELIKLETQLISASTSDIPNETYSLITYSANQNLTKTIDDVYHVSSLFFFKLAEICFKFF